MNFSIDWPGAITCWHSAIWFPFGQQRRNEKLERILIIHRESDNALSWLSTLGGAFSALGDYMEHCAVIAGRISIHQLRIALRLGDPLIAARCKLWLALSMIQRGYLRRAKRLIREQYQLAHSLPVLDTRLVRMCYGIWAKLQYVHRMEHQAKKKKSARSL
ncbi:uncharacterized protein F58A4.6 isoform X2 [Anabrus simplex]|uniref:uncharacterized protein F58A4.6 isoform X2 n=1 Tax=Anabrus simplex TaxID=316456 RepID=UPI0034DD12B4